MYSTFNMHTHQETENIHKGLSRKCYRNKQFVSHNSADVLTESTATHHEYETLSCSDRAELHTVRFIEEKTVGKYCSYSKGGN